MISTSVALNWLAKNVLYKSWSPAMSLVVPPRKLEGDSKNASDICRSMQVILREFIEADREALRKLFVAARDAAFSWAAVGTHKLEDFDVSTAGERILVAEHSREPIGFASVWQDDSFLHNLFVHPRYQGYGVGKMLLTGCDKYFFSVPTLKCLKANERAKRFYQSQGWRIRSEADGPQGLYVLMEKVSTGDSFKPKLLHG